MNIDELYRRRMGKQMFGDTGAPVCVFRFYRRPRTGATLAAAATYESGRKKFSTLHKSPSKFQLIRRHIAGILRAIFSPL